MVKFENYNANPKGRKTSDCVIRAITCATTKTYNQVLNELVEISIKTGYHIADKKCYEKYLEMLGFVKMKQPRKSNNTKYLIGEVDKVVGKGIALISCAHHLTVVNNCVIYDLWDCRNKSIGNYWVKKI